MSSLPRSLRIFLVAGSYSSQKEGDNIAVVFTSSGALPRKERIKGMNGVGLGRKPIHTVLINHFDLFTLSEVVDLIYGGSSHEEIDEPSWWLWKMIRFYKGRLEEKNPPQIDPFQIEEEMLERAIRELQTFWGEKNYFALIPKKKESVDVTPYMEELTFFIRNLMGKEFERKDK